MKKSVYVLGIIALFILSTGLMFKSMHWPFAGIITVVGFVLFNFMFLPTLFYKLYKSI